MAVLVKALEKVTRSTLSDECRPVAEILEIMVEACP
jgi:hypothetical protein